MTVAIIWLYSVRAECIEAFEVAYGSNGDWAQLFSSGEGYLGTRLHKSTLSDRHYLTIDTWVSAEAYEVFRAARLEEYRAIDARCDVFTESETHVGSFQLVVD